MTKIQLPPKLICERCGYTWYPRQAQVRTCPKCKSVLWDVPIKKKKEERDRDL